MTLQFRVLGPLEIVDGDSSVTIRGAKQRVLLAMLLLNPGEVVPTERLIDALWGDGPPPTATKALQMHVSQLRKVLGPSVLMTHPRGYQLSVDAESVDALRFERLLAAGGYAAALELWRGPAFVDIELSDALRGAVGRLEEERLQAVEEGFNAGLLAGRHAGVVAGLEAHVAECPLRERPREQLMLALYRCGRQAEALDVYRDTRRRFVDELGIEPGRELRELQQRVLAQDPKLDLAPSDSADGLVGRDTELAELHGAVDRAAAGRGALVLVGGEPGIGKSRLADTVARYADAAGFAVAVGRCWEAGGAPPYWPWLQALRELGAGDAAAGNGDADSRFHLFAAVAAGLQRAAAQQPIAVFLDDLHAADPASLQLLQYVAAEVGRAPIVIIGCYRDTEPGSPLTPMLADLMRELAVRRIILRGLDPVAIGTLLGCSASVAARVHAQTDGNPLFAVEVGRLLAADDGDDRVSIPDGIGEAINRRLEGRSGGCREVLVLASVLGREFDVDTLVSVSGMAEEDVWETLEEATAARLVGDVPGAPGRMRFSHMLVRDTVYGSLPGVRRTRLHRQVGEALETLYAAESGPHMAVLAHHFALAGAGVAARAAEYAARAGDRAARQFAYEEAARHYRRALGSVAPDPDRRCELLLSLGEALVRAGDEPGSKLILREASALAEAQQRPDRLVRAALAYGGGHWARASTDPALVPMLERALAGLGDGEDRARVRLLARLADARRDDRDRSRRIALSDEAVTIAERLREPATLLRALTGRWIAAEGPRCIIEPADADGMVALALELGDKEQEFLVRELRLMSVWNAADRTGVDVELETMATLAGELRQKPQRWVMLTLRAILAVMEGRQDDAERLIAQASSLGFCRWNTAVSERLARFALLEQQGRLAEIGDVIDRSVREFPTLLRFRCAQAHVSASIGRDDDARRQLAALLALDLRDEHVDGEWIFSLCLLPDVCARLRDADAAAKLYSLLAPHAGSYALAPVEAAFGSVARALAVLAATAGRRDAAAEHYESAIAIERRMRARPWLERAERELAALG